MNRHFISNFLYQLLIYTVSNHAIEISLSDGWTITNANQSKNTFIPDTAMKSEEHVINLEFIPKQIHRYSNIQRTHSIRCFYSFGKCKYYRFGS